MLSTPDLSPYCYIIGVYTYFMAEIKSKNGKLPSDILRGKAELKSALLACPSNASLFTRTHQPRSHQPSKCLHVPRTSPAPPKKITANIRIHQSVPRFRPQPLAWLPSAPTRRPPATRSFPSVPPSRIMRGASAVLTAESPASLWNPASLTKSTPTRPTPSYGSVLTKRYACCVTFFVCIRA